MIVYGSRRRTCRFMDITFGPIPPAPEDLLAQVAAAATIPSAGTYAKPGDLEPDFATLFAAADHVGPVLDEGCQAYLAGLECAACEQAITPRVASALHAAAEVLFEHVTEGAAEQFDEATCTNSFGLGEVLPPVALRYAAANPGWLGTFLATVRNVGLRLAAGEVPYPRSTAEEMALHAVMDHTDDWFDTLFFIKSEGEDCSFFALPFQSPGSGDDFEDIEAVAEAVEHAREVLFEDWDVLMLFDRALDGIEESDDHEMMGFANLHPRDWFTPFAAAQDVA